MLTQPTSVSDVREVVFGKPNYFTHKQIKQHQYEVELFGGVRIVAATPREIPRITGSDEPKYAGRLTYSMKTRFHHYVEALANKLITGAIAQYCNGYAASYWRNIGYLDSTGFSERQLHNAVEIRCNELFRGQGVYALVTIKQHPSEDKSVIELVIKPR